MALTPKKKKFADEIKKGANQTQAYKKAYNCKNMKSETITNLASKLMRDPDVITRLQKIQDKLDKSTIADAQEVQETLTKLLRGEIKEECVAVEGVGNGESRATLIEKQITPKDRIKAGELLSKLRGDFTINHNIIDTPIIKDDI